MTATVKTMGGTAARFACVTTSPGKAVGTSSRFDHVCDALDVATQFLARCKADGLDLTAHDVVFDIDDTIICDELHNPPLKLFWVMCGALGLKRHIITARPDGVLDNGVCNRAATMSHLQSCGMADYDSMYLMPQCEYKACRGNASAYKHAVRRQIIKGTGFPLLLNIGDQWSDMGELSDRQFMARRRDHDPAATYLCGLDDTYVLGIKLPEDRD